MSMIDTEPGFVSAKAYFDAGHKLFEAGNIDAAHEQFTLAHQRDTNSARIRSYYGLSLGLSCRAFEESVELCEAAAKQEFFNPEHYLNLARLYVGFGFRSQAVRYLRRGLMIDPGNHVLSTLLRQVGDRRNPVLAFLPRRHPVNRWLGAARHVLVGRGPMRRAA
jgi:tetratricopeptide (TPR) repeat protein